MTNKDFEEIRGKLIEKFIALSQEGHKKLKGSGKDLIVGKFILEKAEQVIAACNELTNLANDGDLEITDLDK